MNALTLGMGAGGTIHMTITNQSIPLIGVLYGGKSGEHDVSVVTAFSVMKANDYSKYAMLPIYITYDGVFKIGQVLNSFHYAASDELRMGETTGPRSHQFDGQIQQERLQSLSDFLLVCKNEGVSVLFPLLHGTYGEDGVIQGLFEMAHIPYVGAGVLASACGMDKVAMKRMFAQAGLPNCTYRSFYAHQWHNEYEHWVTEIEVVLGYPCFVKPANLGSSVGIGKARNRDELLAVVENALRFDQRIIVEEYIDGREIEVSVLGNEYPEASLPGEIVSSNDFYDYNAKYVDGKSTMHIPALISEEQIEQIRALAVQAYRAVDASGLSRVDFFLVKETGDWLVNEINTMPGFTPFSMYPLMWQATGKPYAELLDDLIRLAIERFESRHAISYSFNKEEKAQV